MKKKYLKILSLATFATGILFSSGCGCNGGKVKVTFVSEGNSDIIRYVKKGKSIIDLPTPPEVKGKYCVWDKQELKNVNEDTIVTAICHSTVTELYTNIDDVINVDVSSEEADLDYILKDAELEVTFESGEKKKLYSGDYIIEKGNYNKDIGGSYLVSLKYNNAKKDITINVKKKSNYVTVSLDGGFGYYNEGLPNLVANTDVAGSISFDEGQTLYVGSNKYTWTFVPENSDKYDIVKGSIDVILYNASEVKANKNKLTVAYGTTKAQIINKIKEGLVVEAKYGNAYREIDPKHYTIECDDFVEDRGNSFEFKIIYDSQNYHTVMVHVEKNKDYDLIINNVSNFIMYNDSNLDDVIDYIDNNIDGRIEFKEGQRLVAGNYEYEYVFIPRNSNYASREGKIRITAYKAQELNYIATTNFAYGSSETVIINGIKDSITGSVIYNDSYTLNIDKSNVSITISSAYNGEAGEYEYTLNYDNQIIVTSTFTINKKILALDVDFDFESEDIDPNNKSILPASSLVKLNNDIEDDLNELFDLVQVGYRDIGEGKHEYDIELVVNESHPNAYKYQSFIITIELEEK